MATFNVLHDPTYQCNQCTKRLPPVERDLRKGCSKTLDKAFSSWRDLIKFRKCPANFFNAYWSATIDNFRQYQNGLLPFKGSLLEQPNKVIEAYSFIETLKVEYENDIHTKQMKAMKRKK